jgi:hypothetical protein
MLSLSWLKALFFPFLFVVENASGGGGVPGEQTSEPKGEQSEGKESLEGIQKDNPGGDLEGLPDWAKKEIKSLRKESATYRNNHKTLAEKYERLEGGLKSALGVQGQEEEVSLEDQLSSYQEQVRMTELNNAILSLAIQNSIPSDELDYFAFKMQKTLESLEEGQELTEEDFGEIIQQVKSRGKGPANSSVGGHGEPNPHAKEGVTLDSFVKMTILEKNQLYREKPDVYQAMFSQAKLKGLLK